MATKEYHRKKALEYYYKNKNEKEFIDKRKKYKYKIKDKVKEYNKLYKSQHLKEHTKHQQEYYKNNKKYINKWFIKTRYLVKLELISMLGGKCSICGYKKCIEGLDFHHKNKDLKVSGIADMIAKGIAITKIIKEVKKCIVLCANCHRELHFKQKHLNTQSLNKYM